MQNIDVCIIGGGLAGLSAAVRSAQLGARSLILEQGSEPLYACNSRYSGGVMHLAFIDMGKPPDELTAALLAKLPPDLDAGLIAAIGGNSRRTLDWLRGTAAARFVRGGTADWQRWTLAPVRPRRPGLVWPGRGSDALMRRLELAHAALGGMIWRGSTATDVVPLPDGTFQVTFLQDGVERSVLSKSVMLADGGFQGNPTLVAQHLAPLPSAVLSRHAGTARGFAMTMAERLGIETTAPHRFYGHMVSADALVNPRLWPWPTLDELAMAGVTVTDSGARATGPVANGVELANHVAALGGPPTFVVVDDRAWQDIGRKTRVVPANPFLEQAGGRMFHGPSVAAVATSAGVSASGLAATIEAINAGRSASGPGPAPIVVAPFHIIPAIAGITYTMGGLAVHDDGAVRTNGGGRIPGLYAIGASAGGAEGGESTFYLGGLAKAAISGLLAGESAGHAVASLSGA